LIIDIHYTITKPEYVEAQQLFIKRKRRKSSVVLRRIFALVLAISVGIVVTLNSHSVALTAGVVLGYILLVLAILLLGPLAQRFILSRRFTTEVRLLTNVHIVIDEASYRAKIPGIGESVTEWTAFTSWLEGKQVFELIVGYTFRPIPKRLLSLQQQDELRTLLAQKIAKTQ
jgi:hypothetical protein